MKRILATLAFAALASSAYAEEIEYLPTARMVDFGGGKDIFRKILETDIKRYPGKIQSYWLNNIDDCKLNGRKLPTGRLEGSIVCASAEANKVVYTLVNGYHTPYFPALPNNTCTRLTKVNKDDPNDQTFAVACEGTYMQGTAVLQQ